MPAAASERMSRVDTAWLRMDNDVNLMMIVGVWLLQPGVSLSALRQRMADKLLKYDRFRQKAVHDAMGALWVEDEDFDIARHVVPAALDLPAAEHTPQQAQQVKPTLIFQYAGDLPVYATSHLHAATDNRSQYLDLEGIRFAETPWLLDDQLPLRQQIEAKWPQAGGSLGRLYAMGADAYLLAPRLGQLVALPDTSLQGLSGDLSLGESQRIERELPWAIFRDGQVQPLEDMQY